MIRLFTLFALLSTIVLAKPISYNEIDLKKSAIQVLFAKKSSSLKSLQKAFDNKYDTYVQKRKYYVYYIVNIDSKNRQTVLKDVKRLSKSAFFINANKILSSNKETTSTQANTVSKSEVQAQGKVLTKSFDKTQYEVALNYFRAKNYAKAYELFDELFFNNMGNILINYYLGRSAYELGKYEFAMSAYDRILIQEPDNLRVRLEYAQTYFQMQLYSQALKEYNVVLEGKIPDTVRDRVLYMVEVIKSKQQKSFFNVTTLFALSYDSNINSSPSAGAYSIYEPTTDLNLELTNDGNETGAMIFQTAAILNHKYKFSDRYLFDTTLTGLLLKYKNYKEKDILAFSASFKPTYFKDTHKFGFEFIFDKVEFAHTPYQTNFYIKPEYSTTVGDKKLYTTAIKAGRVQYENEENKDAYLLQWSNSLKVANDIYGIFTYDVTLGMEEETQPTRTDVSFQYLDLKVANSYEFENNYTLNTSVAYSMDMYEDTDVNFLSKREDKDLTISTNIQKMLSKNMLINFGGSYTKHDSNHAVYEYDKYTIKSTLVYSF